ncbi:MAG: DUF3050 domain-containing protein [Rhodomicrobium sp.]
MTGMIEPLKTQIAKEYAAVSSHPVFDALETVEDLHIFMERHVFAVWDFMSLLKRLQRELTTIGLPWTPPASVIAARHINEIVLGEETDEAPGGRHMSHYELYVESMREVGANPAAIEKLMDLLRGGESIEVALGKAGADPAVARFVTATTGTALNGSLPQVLGSFFYGRENVIPHMFRRLLERWKIDGSKAPVFVFYLERHIELDSERHGPLAEGIIEELVKDEASQLELLNAALAAVRQRRQLWDGVLERLRQRR